MFTRNAACFIGGFLCSKEVRVPISLSKERDAREGIELKGSSIDAAIADTRKKRHLADLISSISRLWDATF